MEVAPEPDMIQGRTVDIHCNIVHIYCILINYGFCIKVPFQNIKPNDVT